MKPTKKVIRQWVLQASMLADNEHTQICTDYGMVTIMHRPRTKMTLEQVLVWHDDKCYRSRRIRTWSRTEEIAYSNPWGV